MRRASVKMSREVQTLFRLVVVVCGEDGKFLHWLSVMADVGFCFERAAARLRVPSTTLRSRVYRARERMLRAHPMARESVVRRGRVSYGADDRQYLTARGEM